MEIYFCGQLVTTVTFPQNGNQWLPYDTVLTNVTTGGAGNCSLLFKSLSDGSGGVTPTNVQLVPIGSATTNPYPMIPIDGEPGCPQIPQADFVKKGTGKRCQQAGILAPDSVWATYPPAPNGPAGTGVGKPNATHCWIYCR